MSDDTRDKVIRLETKVESLERKLCEAVGKLDEIHGAFLQAKGARYIIVGSAAVAGAITGFGVKFLPWIGSLPK